MEQQITIARPAAEVFRYLADPAHLRDWLPQLRREESVMPEQGLEADEAARTVRWSFDPAGSWHVAEVQGVTRLTLHLSRDTAPPADPTGPESPEDAARFSAEAALQSLKSHLEGVSGGDPDLHTPDTPSRAFGHSATQDPDI